MNGLKFQTYTDQSRVGDRIRLSRHNDVERSAEGRAANSFEKQVSTHPTVSS
jgi:hypothetical protein